MPPASAPRWRARLRVALLLAIVALYAASIPWYRAGGAETGTWWGLPTWVMAALVCYALVAVLNALAWLLTDVPDAPQKPRPASRNGKDA